MTRHRVLIIDDEPTFRSQFTSFLRTDYLVSVAGGGGEGFNKALEHTPDLAIVDMQMPGWDGLTTLRAFRGHPSLKGVPVMIVSSDASRETVVAAIQAGANDYLLKLELNREEFLRKVEKLVTVQVAETPPSATRGVGNSPHGTAPHLPGTPHHRCELQATIDSWE